ncbi:hypothetical protein B0T20DRAFT_411754 [Sordaria brevicollis]|uniref:Secreted protein n=1 Tax=Sordaria brevicollis TaxID=83679 RepID=A0AAE0UC29_SORBR|nr:hypothetical protein B0T20DRAFT_411754 [Sordaria brevicollis]
MSSYHGSHLWLFVAAMLSANDTIQVQGLTSCVHCGLHGEWVAASHLCRRTLFWTRLHEVPNFNQQLPSDWQT